MEKKFIRVALISLAAIILVAAVAEYLQRTNQTFRGSRINPPATAYDFTLTDQAGKSTSLTDFKGKYVLLFFGYTNCPNECPATMAILKQVRIDLGSQADKVQVIMISTDPARDTPEQMSTFVSKFDPTFVGLTGTTVELQKVWQEYGVTVLSSGETHSLYVYLIDPDGKMRLTYSAIQSPDDIVADLHLLLK